MRVADRLPGLLAYDWAVKQALRGQTNRQARAEGFRRWILDTSWAGTSKASGFRVAWAEYQRQMRRVTPPHAAR